MNPTATTSFLEDVKLTPIERRRSIQMILPSENQRLKHAHKNWTRTMRLLVLGCGHARREKLLRIHPNVFAAQHPASGTGRPFTL